MDNYGLNMQGSFLIQKVQVKPTWTVVDAGRMILEVSTGQHWLGGDSSDDGVDGWIPIGLIEGTVKNKHIDWDTALTGDEDKISAENIPCLYDTTSIVNVQTAVNELLDLIEDVASGSLMGSGSIRVEHLNFTASSFPIDNDGGTFVGPEATVESALEEVAGYSASDWELDNDSTFGSELGISANSIQEALDELENYLSNLNGFQVKVTYAGTGSESSLQGALDAMHYEFSERTFTDLEGTPNNYGVINNYLISTGNGTAWTQLLASNMHCQYPGTTDTQVQAALWVIQGQISTLESGLSSVNAEAQNVSYDNPTYTNVDDALDFLLAHAYTATRPPNAVNVVSSGIGGADNVQESLEYLQTQLNQVIAMVPVDVTANDVSYNAPSGHTHIDGALDYVYSQFTDIDNELNNKSDSDHVHSDLYYDKTTIDELLPANFDDFYYRKDEVDELAAQTIQSVFNSNTSPTAIDESEVELVTCDYSALATEELAIIIAAKITSPDEDTLCIKLYKDDTTLISSTDIGVLDTDAGKTFSLTVPDTVSLGSHQFKLVASISDPTASMSLDDASILIHRVTNGG